MGETPAFACVGDNCVDRYLPPVGRKYVGGNAVNVAVQLAMLGCRAAYFGAVGLDEDGDFVMRRLAEVAVDTTAVTRRAGVPTACTGIALDASGERRFVFEEFGACRFYRPSPEDVVRLRRMKHVHIGWLDDGGALKDRLAVHGVAVSQDLSVNADPADLDPEGLSVAFASVNGSREQAAALARRLVQHGARLAAVTCGGAGSVAFDGEELLVADARKIAVLDSTGAGDAFAAGFIAALHAGRPLASCLSEASQVAGTACSYRGGFPQEPLPLSG